MKTALLALLGFCAVSLPLGAAANGLALEIGFVWVAPQEPSWRAVDDSADSLASIGVGGAWTIARLGELRVDALGSWSVSSYDTSVGGDVDTAFAEHGFELGARLRWARLFFAQPFISLRAGPALGWFAAEGEGRMVAFDVALRVEPAVGVEAFLPFSSLTRLPSANAGTEARSGWAGAGIGVAMSLGYRLQTAYSFDAEPSTDDDDRGDEIPASGPNLGRLALSGVRMGVDVTVRF